MEITFGETLASSSVSKDTGSGVETGRKHFVTRNGQREPVLAQNPGLALTPS